MERKKYDVIVNFDKPDIISSDEIIITKEDYKSIEFDFQLNKNDYTDAQFYIVKPDKTHFSSLIENNKVLIEDSSVFNQVGNYAMGVALYGTDSRLTSTCKGKIKVVDGELPSDDEVQAEANYPILDQLINKIHNLDVNVSKQGAVTTLTITKGDGTQESAQILDGEAATDFNELENKPTTIAGYGITDAYTKSQIDSKISSVYKYKGTVANYSNLPSSDLTVGDVYNITNADASHGIDAGDNVAWTGTAWDKLGGDVDLSDYYNKSAADTLLAGKVDKVNGKGLSTNDYTDAEKTKLSGIETGAQVNKIEKITLNGAELPINNKTVDIPLAEEILCEKFASIQDDGVYTVKFPLWATSNSSTGEKLDDNVGKSITPATDTTAEVNNYSEAWRGVDCNFYVDNNGVRHIPAIKGMSSFKDTGKVDVGRVYKTCYFKVWIDNGYLYISKTFRPKDGYNVVPQAINKDGTISPWFIIPKYVAGDIEGRLYGSKGLIPAHYLNMSSSYNPSEEEFSDGVSYSGMITLAHARGNYYSAGLMMDYMFILLSFYIQFATRNTQSIMKGNTDNNYQYAVATTESDVHRVILTTAQAANIDLNTYVSVGDKGSNTSNDRVNAYMHNIAYNVKVIGKEVIDENTTALILDHPNFNTTATTYVSTMHERSGFSDYILGDTGSIGSNSNGKHGFVYNGVELAVGGYEVVGNAFMDIIDATNQREVYYTNDSTKLTSTVATAKTTYKKSSSTIQPTTLNAWNYITEMTFDTEDGMMLATGIGGTGSGSSVGYADGFYADNSSSGQREFLLLGSLFNGAAAGLSCVHGDRGISYGYWSILARLSPNAVGGELA